MCLRTHIGEGRQFSGNICTMINLFDKAVAEGGEIIALEMRSEGDDETIRNIASQIASYIYIYRNPATLASL